MAAQNPPSPRDFFQLIHRAGALSSALRQIEDRWRTIESHNRDEYRIRGAAVVLARLIETAASLNYTLLLDMRPDDTSTLPEPDPEPPPSNGRRARPS